MACTDELTLETPSVGGEVGYSMLSMLGSNVGNYRRSDISRVKENNSDVVSGDNNIRGKIRPSKYDPKSGPGIPIKHRHT